MALVLLRSFRLRFAMWISHVSNELSKMVTTEGMDHDLPLSAVNGDDLVRSGQSFRVVGPLTSLSLLWRHTITSGLAKGASFMQLRLVRRARNNIYKITSYQFQSGISSRTKRREGRHGLVEAPRGLFDTAPRRYNSKARGAFDTDPPAPCK
jgi:hypothetical protein